MKRFFLLSAAILAVCCSTLPPGETPPEEDPTVDETPAGPLPKALVVSAKVDGRTIRERESVERISLTPSIALEFSRDIKADESSLSSVDFSGGSLSVAVDPSNSTVLVFRPLSELSTGTRYRFTISAGECFGVNLQKEFTFWLTTAVE
ncbi:MAG: Ig-like domain-containing protein, partial [Bacteroidales bacterium]|nr:Ig-like domain-containing protein [Bacteroidales bacterium]